VTSPLGGGFESHPARLGHTPDGFGDSSWLFTFSEDFGADELGDVFESSFYELVVALQSLCSMYASMNKGQMLIITSLKWSEEIHNK
jgi:hypothetical protein